MRFCMNRPEPPLGINLQLFQKKTQYSLLLVTYTQLDEQADGKYHFY